MEACNFPPTPPSSPQRLREESNKNFSNREIDLFILATRLSLAQAREAKSPFGDRKISSSHLENIKKIDEVIEKGLVLLEIAKNQKV